MTKMFAVDAERRTIKAINVHDVSAAYRPLGLKAGEVDFGTICQDDQCLLSIVVYEYGLFVPPESQNFFSIGDQLFAGNAVIFLASRETGEAIDLDIPPPICFYRSHVEVEGAIRSGSLQRPEMRVNNQLLWVWPQQRL